MAATEWVHATFGLSSATPIRPAWSAYTILISDNYLTSSPYVGTVGYAALVNPVVVPAILAELLNCVEAQVVQQGLPFGVREGWPIPAAVARRWRRGAGRRPAAPR